MHVRQTLGKERSRPQYARRREADVMRRVHRQAEYVEDFGGAVLPFLAFHARHRELALQLAQAVTDHATPVGNGTVARTTRLPLAQRAEAAVIVWMRHQASAYDTMTIARVKGKRREVRRLLAQRSQQLLERYCRGDPVSCDCPLQIALLGKHARRLSASP